MNQDIKAHEVIKPDPLDKIYSVADLIELMRKQYGYPISKNTVYRWIDEKGLPVVFGNKVIKRYHIRLGDFLDFISSDQKETDDCA